jgi:hypothetical protein
MSEGTALRLPSKKDWAWALGLLIVGAALGFTLNALSPVGINLRIALDLDSPPPASDVPQAAPGAAAGAPGATTQTSSTQPTEKL